MRQSLYDRAYNGNPRKPSVLLALLILHAVNVTIILRDRYFRNLDEAVMSEVRNTTQLPDVSSADLHRILPTIYDAATCYHAKKWGIHFYETWVDWWWDLIEGELKLRRDYTIEATREEHSLESWALWVLALVVISPLCFIILLIFLLLFWVPASDLAVPSTSGDLYGILSLWIIVSLFQWCFHRLLPYRYLAFALFIECSLAIAVLHTVSAWSPSINKGWRTFYATVPKKYRVLLPGVHPTSVVLAVVWLMAVICLIRLLVRITNYIGCQLSDRRQFPGYKAAAQQSSSLILDFLGVSYVLAEWERDIPDRKATDQQILASKLPPRKVRGINYTLAIMAHHVHRYWKVAMRSSGTPAGERMAHNASRITYFLEYQRLRSMLGSANYIKVRQAMVTALVEAADGNWHLIGRGDEYDPVVMTARWKIFVRRLAAIALPIAAAIIVSMFARKIPSIYIQSILLICIGFAGVQVIGLIDPDALARLDLATKVSGVFKR